MTREVQGDGDAEGCTQDPYDGDAGRNTPGPITSHCPWGGCRLVWGGSLRHRLRLGVAGWGQQESGARVSLRGEGEETQDGGQEQSWSVCAVFINPSVTTPE